MDRHSGADRREADPEGGWFRDEQGQGADPEQDSFEPAGGAHETPIMREVPRVRGPR